jgi:VWFA-related protein
MPVPAVRMAGRVVLATALGGSLTAQVPPAFRSSVNSVVLDLQVLDEDGRFVRDLMKEDFEVFENSEAQAIELVELVDLPVEVPEPSPWSDVPADSATNDAVTEGRLYVLVLDDLHVHPLRAATIRALAREFVERHVGSSDLVAIAATSGRRALTQEFTSDRQRLFSVIETLEASTDPFAPLEVVGSLTGGGGFTVPAGGGVVHGCTDCRALTSLRFIADWLGDIDRRRKAVVFISEGLHDDLSDAFTNPNATTIVQLTRELMTSAARANVGIYAIDARGNPGADATTVRPVPTLVDEIDAGPALINARQSLTELGEETGGFALVHSNAFAEAFDRVVRENSSYYLLGYTPTNTSRDGQFRRIDVRVKRPALRVVARRGYMAPGKEDKNQPAGAVESGLTVALNSPVPVAGLPLRVSAIPMFGRRDRASVAVVVEVHGRELELREAAGGTRRGVVEVAVAAAGPDGKIADSERARVNLNVRPANYWRVSDHGVRVATRLDLKPGRYQLRAAAQALGRNLSGSVQYDLDVPDLSKGPLSMSGILVTSPVASAAPTIGPFNWRSLLPGPPTANREFGSDDRLDLAVQAYAGNEPEVKFSLQIEREDGSVAFTAEDTAAPEGSNPRRYPFEETIPLAGFAPGRYLMTVRARSAANPDRQAERRLVFTVR